MSDLKISKALTDFIITTTKHEEIILDLKLHFRKTDVLTKQRFNKILGEEK